MQALRRLQLLSRSINWALHPGDASTTRPTAIREATPSTTTLFWYIKVPIKRTERKMNLECQPRKHRGRLLVCPLKSLRRKV